MGCRILYDRTNELAALYCSTSDVAFGPLFQSDNHHEGDERAESFLRWLPIAPKWARYEKTADFGDRDPRCLTEGGLQLAFADWLVQETAQWKRDDAPTCDCGEPAVEFPGETLTGRYGEIHLCQSCHDAAFSKSEAR